MSRIITTSELQKTIGQLQHHVEGNYVIITNRGKAKMVLMPYFEENDELIERYLEEYAMQKNKSALQRRYRGSAHSGKSDLEI